MPPLPDLPPLPGQAKQVRSYRVDLLVVSRECKMCFESETVRVLVPMYVQGFMGRRRKELTPNAGLCREQRHDSWKAPPTTGMPLPPLPPLPGFEEQAAGLEFVGLLGGSRD